MILAALLDRGVIMSLVSNIETKIDSDDTLNQDLAVISIVDLKIILEKMGKEEW